jgi:hypothetical protein
LKFRDEDWESDLIDKSNFEAIDQEDSPFINDLDANDENIEDSSDKLSDQELDPELDFQYDSDEICFALPPLTEYPDSFSRNEILEKLNLFAENHSFAPVARISNMD